MHLKSDSYDLNVFVDIDGSPDRDLALEADFFELSSGGMASVFFYSWQSPVVVLGYGQKVDDVDLDWCREKKVPVYRRMTGGTGVVHQQDLAVSLFLPSQHRWAEKINQLYRLFLGALAPALEAAGGAVRHLDDPQRSGRERSPICFEDQLADTLVIDGRKVVGCAQARRSRAVLIHAAVSLNLAVDIYAGAFKVSEERIQRGLGEAIPGGHPSEVTAFVKEALGRSLGINLRSRDLPEPSRDNLQKYCSSHWAPLFWSRE